MQHGIGAQLAVEFKQGDMADDTGQVNGRFYAGVTAADHRHTLALEQRAIAMRAEAHALGLVFLLAGHTHLSPARACGQDHGLGLEGRTAFEANFVQLTGIFCRNQATGALQVHDIHVVLTHMGFQCAGQFRPFGFLYRDKVLDGHGVQHLATKAFSRHTGTNTFTCRIDGSRRPGRATANYQDVEGILGADFLRGFLDTAGVELGEDFFQAHTALAKVDPVQVDTRDRHDLALIDFSLEQRAINRNVADVRVQHGHQVQRLDHVRAVLARQREVSLEAELAFEGADLFNHFDTGLRRVATDLQQGQHQRSEFMAHGDTGETQADLGTRAVDGERWLARIIAIGVQSNQRGEAGYVLQKSKHFLGFRTVVEGGDDLDRLGDPFQV